MRTETRLPPSPPVPEARGRNSKKWWVIIPGTILALATLVTAISAGINGFKQSGPKQVAQSQDSASSDDLKTTLARLNQENQGMREKLTETSVSWDEQNKKLASLNQENQGLRDQLAQVSTSSADLERKIASRDQDNQSLREELAQRIGVAMFSFPAPSSQLPTQDACKERASSFAQSRGSNTVRISSDGVSFSSTDNSVSVVIACQSPASIIVVAGRNESQIQNMQDDLKSMFISY